MDKSQKFLFLDLELNQPSQKIIQVGICIASYQDYIDDTGFIQSYYLDPNEPISPEIVELCGIDDQMIQRLAVCPEMVHADIIGHLDIRKPFLNPVTWGGGDSSTLIDLFFDNNLSTHIFGRRWIDLKTIYQFMRFSDGKSFKGGLSSAMGTISKSKLQFRGVPHRADVDAYNTMRLFFWMAEQQNAMFELVKDAKEIYK